MRCRHCRIFFFTHPRNAGRVDLGCPFGCRAEHRRRDSAKRSAEYYQGEVGKLKKKKLNAKRGELEDRRAGAARCFEDEAPCRRSAANDESAASAAWIDASEAGREPLEKAAAGQKLSLSDPESVDTAPSQAPVEGEVKYPDVKRAPAILAPQADAAEAALPTAGPEKPAGSEDEDEFNEGIIEHVQLLAHLIDGEDFSRHETVRLLKRIMRQRSIAKGSALDYVLGQLEEKPP